MDKLICEHCGAELTIEKKFCSECGVSNPHYVEPDIEIEAHLPSTIQELFDWYQMKFGYNNFIRVFFRTFQKEPNSYCIFKSHDVFYVYHHGESAEMDHRTVVYEGKSEKDAVRALCVELEKVYDEMAKSNFRKKINYTEITNIDKQEHYDYGRLPQEYLSASGRGSEFYPVHKTKISKEEIEAAKERKRKMRTPEDIRSEKIVTFITYAIIAVLALIFFFFASFSGVRY